MWDPTLVRKVSDQVAINLVHVGSDLAAIDFESGNAEVELVLD